MHPTRTLRILTALLIGLSVSHPVAGQVVSGQTLTGDWVRIDSNNNPNDLMRIAISGSAGVLTSVPAAASSYWSVGQTLWRALQANGSLEVRGSDGNYYPATLTVLGPDDLELAIHYPGGTAGDAQEWRRAGADISGDWVLVAPGTPGDGTRVQVQGVDADVRYLTASAPRQLRVGTRLWQGIGASGGLQVLGSDRNYHKATWSLVSPNRLQVNAPALAGGAGQIWVRPTAVASTRAGLQNPSPNVQPPPPNPNAPGSGLTPTTPLPGLPPTPTTPPVPAAACLPTSLPHDQAGMDWGFAIHTPTRNSPVEETLGVWEYMGAPSVSNRGSGGRMPVDVERVSLQGLPDGYAYIWERGPSRQSQWTLDRDLTAGGLDGRIQAAKTAGRRPTDILGFPSGSSALYTAAWEANPEGIAWMLEYDLTRPQYDSAFQAHGSSAYRLIDVEIYDTSAGLRYAAIWWASCDDTNWSHEIGMDRNGFQARASAEATTGSRVIDIESYQTPAGQRYAAIWQTVPGRDWHVRESQTLLEFLNDHHEYVDEGMRLIDFESYDTLAGVRYAGVWAENDARYSYPFKIDVDTLVQNYRALHDIPGISVVIMQDDSVMYRRGFGWADSAQGKRANAETIYITASIAKAIGGTVAARLEERGVIDLTDSTSVFLGPLGLPSYHTHTLEQLLSKTGCVRHYSEVSRGFPDVTQAYRWQRDAVVRLWADSMLTSPTCVPGTRYHYSTHGYTYAGAALEVATGKPIGDIIDDELVTPFGLSSLGLVRTRIWTTQGGGGVRPYHLAQAYRRVDTLTNWRRRIAVPYENSTWKVLGGGLMTNALDLARFGWLTLDGQIVSPTTRDTRLWRMLTNGTVQWSNPNQRPPETGLGWELLGKGPRVVTASGSRNRLVAQHQGNARGATTTLRIYRSEGLTIAILSNQQERLDVYKGPHPVDGLATSVATAVFANPPP